MDGGPRTLADVGREVVARLCVVQEVEEGVEEVSEVEEVGEVEEVEAARWEDKKIEKKLGGEGAVIEDAGGAEDMDVEMLDVQDQEEDADEEETDAVGAENDEKGVWIGEELTVHLEFSSFVQIGSKRRKLEANPEPQESDPDEVEVEIPFEESVQEEGEEELQEDGLQDENDSLQPEVEVENLGSGYTTDAVGRVRRFSHRLKAKNCRGE